MKHYPIRELLLPRTTRSVLLLGLLCAAVALVGCTDDAPDDGGNTANNDGGDPNNDSPNNEPPNNDNPNNDTPDDPVCGDGVCEEGEDAQTCADDCGPPPPECGDGTCNGDETFETCADDCEPPPPECGDGTCNGDETFETCAEDCPPPPECEDGDFECRGGRAFACEGGMWTDSECPEGQICAGEACADVICAANEARCIDDATVGICGFDGTTEEAFPCPDGSFCENAQCLGGCEVGTRSCQGDDVVECQEDGRTQEVVETCSPAEGTACVEGDCVSSCDAFSVKGGYIGCDYWGVDTPNRFGTRNIFAFVVSNIDDNAVANVTVETVGGEILLEQAVDPLEVATLRMPMPRAQNIDESSVSDLAFRLSTDVPINAYQFNPLQRFDNDMGVSVASNDASLMIPDSALGTEYIGAAFTHWSSYASFLSIVSTTDENSVTVTPSTTVASGPGVPAIPAGQAETFELSRGQTLTLKSASGGGDLTGTIITSDENVAVYGGVDCAQVPIGRTYCDHIEEKLFPVQAWDNVYYATKFQPRGVESDIWRIIASTDGTTLTMDPPQGNPPMLNRGEFYEFSSTGDFKIEANHPILVAQYMTGSSTTNAADSGDPAMLLTVPARQYRRDYVFLVPDTYDDDWVTIVYPDGAAPMLDGEPIDVAQGTAIGASGFKVLRLSVTDGRHEITSDLPVGLSVYGYDFNISYAYPAGLDLSAFQGEE